MGLRSGGASRVRGGGQGEGRRGVCGEVRRLRKMGAEDAERVRRMRRVRRVRREVMEDVGCCWCLRTCETLFEGSLCLATLIDAFWPGRGGKEVERLTKYGEAGWAARAAGGSAARLASRSVVRGWRLLATSS